MKRIVSLIVAVGLVVGMSFSTFGAVASWLDLGTGVEVFTTVKTTAGSTTVSGTAYPSQATGMFNEINNVRKAAGLHALERNTNLTDAAKQRALEISVKMSHTRPDGTSWRTVDYQANGENLGIDMVDFYDVVHKGFMESPEHKKRILDTDFNSVETYCVNVGNDLYWVQLFSVQTKEEIQQKVTPVKTTTPANPSDTALSEGDMVAKMKAAPVKNGSKTVAVDNPYAVAPKTLGAMQAAAGNVPAYLRADTRTKNGTFIGRITVDASQGAKNNEDILLTVEIDNSYTKSTEDFFAKWFKNETQVVGLRQQGSFGAPVRTVAKLTLKDTTPENLVFYNYNRTTNKYSIIDTPNYYIDTNGFIHFDVAAGGDIVISKGQLTK